MKTLARLRWRIATLLDKLPGQCWTELVMFGLGYRRNPWSPMDSTCRSDRDRCGACYCGKLRKREDPRPIHDGGRGDFHCPFCWTPSGERHELSCPEVTPEQFHAYLDGAS